MSVCLSHLPVICKPLPCNSRWCFHCVLFVCWNWFWRDTHLSLTEQSWVVAYLEVCLSLFSKRLPSQLTHWLRVCKGKEKPEKHCITWTGVFMLPMWEMLHWLRAFPACGSCSLAYHWCYLFCESPAAGTSLYRDLVVFVRFCLMTQWCYQHWPVVEKSLL